MRIKIIGREEKDCLVTEELQLQTTETVCRQLLFALLTPRNETTRRFPSVENGRRFKKEKKGQMTNEKSKGKTRRLEGGTVGEREARSPESLAMLSLNYSLQINATSASDTDRWL